MLCIYYVILMITMVFIYTLPVFSLGLTLTLTSLNYISINTLVNMNTITLT